MSIFKTKGFDTVISVGTSITGKVFIPAGSTLVIDGEVNAQIEETGEASNTTKIIINGKLITEDLTIGNLIVNARANVICQTLIITNTLAIKKDGILTSTDKIHYNKLVIEVGAKISGLMQSST